MDSLHKCVNMHYTDVFTTLSYKYTSFLPQKNKHRCHLAPLSISNVQSSSSKKQNFQQVINLRYRVEVNLKRSHLWCFHAFWMGVLWDSKAHALSIVVELESLNFNQ